MQRNVKHSLCLQGGIGGALEILLPDNVVGLGQVPSHRKLGPSSAQWFGGEMQTPALEGACGDRKEEVGLGGEGGS